MPAKRLYRATPTELEIRGGDGRTVVGIAVPFDSPTEIREAGRSYTETFRRGAFAKSISERGPNRVKFLTQHDHKSLPIGRATVLREDQRGLYGEFYVSRTRAGDETLELVKDGALDSLSVAFDPIQNHWAKDRTSVERIEAKLHEVSVVTFGAYTGALIAGVRSVNIRTLTSEAASKRLDLLNHTYKDYS